MKQFMAILILAAPFVLYAQDTTTEQDIKELIAQYTQARESRDTVLLDQILVAEVDQLVSSGTWRRGKDAAKQGMMRSSSRNPGKRTITVEKVRLVADDCAIADARYEIGRADGTTRKMWSTFVVVQEGQIWKIAAIRNMLPAR
ncbi:MAG: nuclear transport factor 2 family protein [Bacteroidota bacterium]